MKTYQLPLNYSQADSLPPKLPKYTTGDAPVDDPEVACVFSNEGTYMGWTTEKIMKGYLYGNIYYHTKRALSISTSVIQGTSLKLRKLSDKKTSEVLLAFKIGAISELDNLDKDSLLEKARYSLAHEINGSNNRICDYNFEEYLKDPIRYDQFGLLKGFPQQCKKEMDNLYDRFNQLRRDKAQEIIDSEKLIRDASKGHGITLDV